MNGAEVYASRMMLLLVPAKGFRRNKQVVHVLTFITTSGYVNFSREERGWIQPSLFLFLLLAVFSGFNCLLSTLTSSKRQGKAKDFFLGPVLA
jgi:hypothetical protein